MVYNRTTPPERKMIMFTLHEDEKAYRHGDHGPKYLMMGPTSNFGIVKLLPGNVVSPHYHEIMEENFYILEGTVSMTVNDVKAPARLVILFIWSREKSIVLKIRALKRFVLWLPPAPGWTMPIKLKYREPRRTFKEKMRRNTASSLFAYCSFCTGNKIPVSSSSSSLTISTSFR